jgi:hypothetical protein
MPIYPRPRNDSRALARELGDLRRNASAAIRRPHVNVPNPTPPPVSVAPSADSLVEWLLDHEDRESQ